MPPKMPPRFSLNTDLTLGVNATLEGCLIMDIRCPLLTLKKFQECFMRWHHQFIMSIDKIRVEIFQWWLLPGINTGIKDPSRLVWTEVIGVLYQYEPGRDLRQYQVYTSLIPNSIPGLYLPHTRQKSVFEPMPGPGSYVSFKKDLITLVWKF